MYKISPTWVSFLFFFSFVRYLELKLKATKYLAIPVALYRLYFQRKRVKSEGP